MTALLITFYSIISFLGKFREFLEVPMRDNFQYGSNFTDHGFKPAWLIFDEMGGSVAKFENQTRPL
jgi:hypothetical protein